MPEETALEERIVGAMQQLGFTSSDARIYLSLLKSHPATGYELATSSGVPRSAIYNTLNRLRGRGLVNPTRGKPVRYLPLEPDRLFQMMESRFHKSLEELRTSIGKLAKRAPENRTWTLSGYAAMLEAARGLIQGCAHGVHLSVWRREAEALSEALRKAHAAGREVVLFSFTRLPSDLGQVLSYGIREPELERYWPHKIILVADRKRVLVGGAQDSEENQALVSEDQALVEMAISNLVLDITLLGQRLGVETGAVVGGLTTYLAPVEELVSRAAAENGSAKRGDA
jgi:sugar-specific transcriptional regulator TrmB